MSFLPETGWGIAYAVANLVAVFFALRRRETALLGVILIAHWVTLRSIVLLAHDVPLAWCLHNAALIAVCVYLRTRLSIAVAACFAPTFFLDQWWLFMGSDFLVNAVIAEACGYLSFLIITGASIDTGGRMDWLRGDAFSGSDNRRGHGLHALAAWSFQRISGLFDRSNSRHMGLDEKGLP